MTTSDDLYRAASDKLFQGEPATKEVLRYREALWHGFDSLKNRPLSTNLFVEIVKIIRQVDSGFRRAPGTVIANPAGEVIYTPPEGESVIREKLANLESFMHSENGLDPLVKLAAIHYQFEAIHPFPDGNGRTRRIINILFLVEKGLLDLPILYLSHYIIQKKSEYYRGLRAVTEEQKWEQWVLYVLDAIETTAYQTIERISQIRALFDGKIPRNNSRKDPSYLLEGSYRAGFSASVLQDPISYRRQNCPKTNGIPIPQNSCFFKSVEPCQKRARNLLCQ